MKQYIKKSILAVMCAGLLMTSLTGCSPKDGQTMATIGDTTLTYGQANFYCRYIQATYEVYASYLSTTPENMWTMDIGSEEGSNFYESTKSSLKKDLEEMVVSYQVREDYGLEITEEQQAAIEEAADAFLEANDEETLEFMNATKDNIVSMLTYMTYQDEVKDAITAQADTNVTDEEALQKKMVYVRFAYGNSANTSNASSDAEVAEITEALTQAMSEAGKEEMGSASEKAVKELKGMTADEVTAYAEEKGYTAAEISFDAEDTSPVAEMCQEAFNLKVGEVTAVYQDEDAGCYYVGVLTSEKDDDATESEKSSIVTQRQNDLYEEVMTEAKEARSIKWNEKMWNKINFIDKGCIDASASDITESVQSYNEDTSLEVADGDTVNINYSGSIDGELFDGGTADYQDLTIGSGSFIDNFEEQLIGAHPGDDVTVTVTFPEDYQSEEVAGKEAEFAVHVNGIY